MIQRIRQFIRAITAHFRKTDREFVDFSIPEAGKVLFYTMHPVDQYHALQVARTAMKLWEELSEEEQKETDRSFLLRCALLHDVGRVKGDLDIWGKVFCVLMVNIAPEYARHGAERGAKNSLSVIDHALYVYFHHAEIGAAKLRAVGLSSEAAIIAKHHQLVRAGDPLVLQLLREADERN